MPYLAQSLGEIICIGGAGGAGGGSMISSNASGNWRRREVCDATGFFNFMP